MALITCLECSKEISDKASTCPNCGYPINEADKLKKQADMGCIKLTCPVFPKDLSIGKQVTSGWSNDVSTSGYFNASENVLHDITDGKIRLLLFEKGIRVTNVLFSPIMDIHVTQLIDIIKTNDIELVEKEKTVIGRAVAGTLLFGPFWGIIGGMSGVGSKKVIKSKYIIIVNFWDIKSREPKSMLMRSDDEIVDLFISRCKRDLPFIRLRKMLERS
jgi:hypothetical protein